MRLIVFFVLLFCFSSCDENKNMELNFIEKSFITDSVSLNLPSFNNGILFAADDSLEYLNIYLINDSTVHLNDTTIVLPRNKKIGSSSFGIFNNYDSSRKYINRSQLSNYFEKSKILNEVQLVLYIDSSLRYESYYEVFIALSENNSYKAKEIYIIDENCSFLSVRLPVLSDDIICGYNSIFEILYNFRGELMINSEWNKKLQEIKPEVIDFYTQYNLEESSFQIDEFNKNKCIKNIAILLAKKSRIKNSKDKNIIQKNLDDWNEILNYTELIGSFRKISKSSIINIQLNGINKVNDYFKILDSINGAVLSLKNNLSEERFNKLYVDLNPKDSIDILRKKAVDFIYPNVINPTYHFNIPLPLPPPPPIKK